MYTSDNIPYGYSSGETPQRRAMQWLSKGKAVACSRLMVFLLLEMPSSEARPPDCISDLNSVFSLLESVPEVKEKFKEIAKLSENWATFIGNFDKIEKLYLQEFGLSSGNHKMTDLQNSKTLEFLEKMYK